LRLKTIQAPTLQAALDQIRRQMGADAIIVATHEDEGSKGVRVTAAVESPAGEDFIPPMAGPSEDMVESLASLLERHGLPNGLIDRILRAVEDQTDASEDAALAAGLQASLRFEPLPKGPHRRPILVMGPPGTGKTTVAAKLAVRATLAGTATTLISADPVRLGANDQMRLYAETIGAEFFAVRDEAGLAAALARISPDRLVVIDTPGVNPYALAELAPVIALGHVGPMDGVLVLGAARDAEEAADIARAFRPAKPKRLIATGLDIARRLGAILAAADACELALADYSPRPTLANGLEPLDAQALAKLLMALAGERKTLS